MRKPFRWFVLGIALAAAGSLVAQRPGGKGKGKGRPSFDEMIRLAIAEGFTGITAKGEVTPRLFKLAQTGVSTAPVIDAANAFLAALDADQRKRASFATDDDEWRKWANQHSFKRDGIGFEELSETQRLLAFSLLKNSLSARGLQTTTDIMRLNGTLGELTGLTEEYNENLYWLSFMGEPSATEPWGWQLDGHHAVINYFVLGDQVVMTPHFLGSEPIRATSGAFKGAEILQDEQTAALEFAMSLTDKQFAQANIGEKTGTNTVSEAFRDNITLDYAGVRAADLTAAQRQGLLDLAAHFIGQCRLPHAEVKMTEIREHLDSTYFGWIGSRDEDAVFYFRIHSPVVLIEFDHQRPIALERTGKPTRNHIHAVVRTPNGNDYGKDLLRQHHLHHHEKP